VISLRQRQEVRARIYLHPYRSIWNSPCARRSLLKSSIAFSCTRDSFRKDTQGVPRSDTRAASSFNIGNRNPAFSTRSGNHAAARLIADRPRALVLRRGFPGVGLIYEITVHLSWRFGIFALSCSALGSFRRKIASIT